MNNKEKIKNFLQNCTEQQFNTVSRFTRSDINIDTTTLYRYRPGDLKPFKIKRIILYKCEGNQRDVEDIFFLSEEDEKAYILKSHELDYWRCTPEYGKYICNKYHLNERVYQINSTDYGHELFKGNVRIAHYIERRHCTFSSSWIEEYKNWCMSFDLNHQLNFTYVKLEEPEEND